MSASRVATVFPNLFVGGPHQRDVVEVVLESNWTFDTCFCAYLIDRFITKDLSTEICEPILACLDHRMSASATHGQTMPIEILFATLLDRYGECNQGLEKIFELFDTWVQLVEQIPMRFREIAIQSEPFIEQFRSFQQDFTFVMEDFKHFDDELIDSNKVSVLEVPFKGTPLKVVIYRDNPKSKLAIEWAKMRGFSVVVQIDENSFYDNSLVRKLHLRLLTHEIDAEWLTHRLRNFEARTYGHHGPDMWTNDGDSVYCTSTVLQFADIKSFFQAWLGPMVISETVRYVFPFHFDYTHFSLLTRRMKRWFTEVDESARLGQLSSRFLPVFNNFFVRNDQSGNSVWHSRSFLLNNEQRLFQSMDLNVAASVRLFRYGVGFLILDANPEVQRLTPLSHVHERDRQVCSQTHELFNTFIGHQDILDMIRHVRRGIVYESIGLEHDPNLLSQRETIVLQTCSADKQTHMSDSDERAAELKQKFLARGDYVFYGFSRSCGVQFLIADPHKPETSLTQLKQRFMDDQFLVFLFAIQQRESMRQFAHRLMNPGAAYTRLKPKKLRKDFIQFLTVGTQSQISDNNVITLFYERWKSVFDSDKIYGEVADQLTIVDEYIRTQYNSRFELASVIVFPVLTLSSLFSMGMFKTTAIFVPGSNVMMVTVILMAVIGWLVYKK